jgi:hypothetical protein
MDSGIQNNSPAAVILCDGFHLFGISQKLSLDNGIQPETQLR